MPPGHANGVGGIVLLHEDGRIVRREAPATRWQALKAAWQDARRGIGGAWRAFWYRYRQQRRYRPTFLASGPVGDPALNAMDQIGIADVLQDEPVIELFKSSGGRYFTRAMLERLNGMSDEQLEAERKAGHYVPRAGEIISQGMEMSHERMEQLIQELEFMQMESGLNENDAVLLKELTRIAHEEDV